MEAGEGIYSNMLGGREKGIATTSKQLIRVKIELRKSFPEAFDKQFPDDIVDTGTDNKTGEKVIKYADGYIRYVK